MGEGFAFFRWHALYWGDFESKNTPCVNSWCGREWQRMQESSK